MRYANIIVDISHEAVDKPFTYVIPDEIADECHPGTKVMVPFGRGNKETMGYIISISSMSSKVNSTLLPSSEMAV